MKSANKTKKELIAELDALRERVSEMERQERNSRQALGNYKEKTDRSFAQMAYMHEAIFVIFDRKLEFVNDKFAELFGVSPEEACSSHFDPMTLIAPESRPFIQEHTPGRVPRRLCDEGVQVYGSVEGRSQNRV